MASDKELALMSDQVYGTNGGTPPSGWITRFTSTDFGIGAFDFRPAWR